MWLRTSTLCGSCQRPMQTRHSGRGHRLCRSISPFTGLASSRRPTQTYENAIPGRIRSTLTSIIGWQSMLSIRSSCRRTQRHVPYVASQMSAHTGTVGSQLALARSSACAIPKRPSRISCAAKFASKPDVSTAGPQHRRHSGSDGTHGAYLVRVRFVSWPHTLMFRAGGIPIFTSRSAVTRDVFDFVIELRPFTTSGRLEEMFTRKSQEDLTK